MGDEVHNRNAAATSLLLKYLAPAILRSKAGRIEATNAVAFIAGNDHFFLNISMAACKTMLDAARGVAGSSMVTAMARNGVEFGIRVSGTGERWFTAPAPVVDGLYFPGYTIADAAPDLGDSAITETAGLGGWIASSGTNTTSAPWPPVAAQRRAASMARRVLPTPPGPVRLIRRDRVSSSDSVASSRSRPMKLDCAIGSRSGLSPAGPGPHGGSRPVVAASSSARARLARGDGRDRPDSHRFTVANDTPSRCASCSWLNPSRVRSSRRRAASGTASSGSLFTQAAYDVHTIAQSTIQWGAARSWRLRRRRLRPGDR